MDGNQTDNSAPSAGAAYVFKVAYTVSGYASGLAAGNEVVLQNNTGGNATINANGNFIFSKALTGGSAYAVSVLNQPTPIKLVL